MQSIMERAALEELRKAGEVLPAKAHGQGQAVATHPAALEVEYWPEDGGYSAVCEALGLSAVAESEAEVFAQMAAVIDEYWEILNERYPTLSDELRGRLDLRYLGLNFTKREA